MIRRLHKNGQNLENRGCVENGCVTSDVRTVLGFVHVTLLNAQLCGLTRITCSGRKVFSMMDEISLEALTWNICDFLQQKVSYGDCQNCRSAWYIRQLVEHLTNRGLRG